MQTVMSKTLNKKEICATLGGLMFNKMLGSDRWQPEVQDFFLFKLNYSM